MCVAADLPALARERGVHRGPAKPDRIFVRVSEERFALQQLAREHKDKLRMRGIAEWFAREYIARITPPLFVLGVVGSVVNAGRCVRAHVECEFSKRKNERDVCVHAHERDAVRHLAQRGCVPHTKRQEGAPRNDYESTLSRVGWYT